MLVDHPKSNLLIDTGFAKSIDEHLKLIPWIQRSPHSKGVPGALTGGEVFSPTASKDLPRIYERILDDLSAQYVLGFVSDDPKRDGRYRTLKVEVSRKGLKLRHRAGYYAPVVGG